MSERAAPRHLSCPTCAAYDVARMYVSALAADSCECMCCGARWDEATASGEVRERGQACSVILRSSR